MRRNVTLNILNELGHFILFRFSSEWSNTWTWCSAFTCAPRTGFSAAASLWALQSGLVKRSHGMFWPDVCSKFSARNGGLKIGPLTGVQPLTRFALHCIHVSLTGRLSTCAQLQRQLGTQAVSPQHVEGREQSPRLLVASPRWPFDFLIQCPARRVRGLHGPPYLNR